MNTSPAPAQLSGFLAQADVVPIQQRPPTPNAQFMARDLARSGLTQEVMGTVAPPPSGTFSELVSAFYMIPYFYRDRTPIVGMDKKPQMYRLRHDVPEESNLPRYTQPSFDDIGALAVYPYFWASRPSGKGGGLYILEGEKKAVVVIQSTNANGIGIGGCWNWKAHGTTHTIHPAIVEEIEE
ncbi:MAG: hypothetical protein KF720_15555, partial [Rubrivivax sp.]|nr:hypothetical protein [Rubrivivax sp.]